MKQLFLTTLAIGLSGHVVAQDIAIRYESRTVHVKATSSRKSEETGKVARFKETVTKPILDSHGRPLAPILIFPNPAKEFIHVEVNGNITMIEIVDMNGSRVLVQPMPSNGKIDVSKLPPGAYILSAKGTLKSYSKKFLITR